MQGNLAGRDLFGGLREEIYCRDSKLDFAKKLVSSLKEIGYVSPSDKLLLPISSYAS